MVWKGDSDGRLAKSLISLIDQVDSQWPNRNRRNDGSIGDKRHQAGSSDHNIGSERNETPGVVTALDITDDPANGCDAMKIAEALRIVEESRVEYVIHKGASTAAPTHTVSTSTSPSCRGRIYTTTPGPGRSYLGSPSRPILTFCFKSPVGCPPSVGRRTPGWHPSRGWRCSATPWP